MPPVPHGRSGSRPSGRRERRTGEPAGRGLTATGSLSVTLATPLTDKEGEGLRIWATAEVAAAAAARGAPPPPQPEEKGGPAQPPWWCGSWAGPVEDAWSVVSGLGRAVDEDAPDLLGG